MKKEHPIFSGEYSRDMWEVINSAETESDLKLALYFVCCRIQKLESRLSRSPVSRSPVSRDTVTRDTVSRVPVTQEHWNTGTLENALQQNTTVPPRVGVNHG